MNLQGTQLWLLEGLDDGADAGEARRLDESRSPRQLPLHGDEEI
jgi:hypothetical protein